MEKIKMEYRGKSIPQTSRKMGGSLQSFPGVRLAGNPEISDKQIRNYLDGVIEGVKHFIKDKNAKNKNAKRRIVKAK